METLVHEIGHAWMMWPHSYAEVPWDEEEDKLSNPYSNHPRLHVHACAARGVWLVPGHAPRPLR